MKNVKTKIKAVLFDMDGTLIKTEHIWQQATSDTLTSRGITIATPEQQRALNSLSGIGVVEAWKLLKATFDIGEDIHELAQETVMRVQDHFRNGISFIDGFEHFHRELAAHNIKSCVATNADDESIMHLSESLNFPHYFGENVFGISRVNNKAKPDPAIFLHAADKLGVKPEECVVFEDSVYGFKAANAAGMKCIAMKYTTNEQHRHHAHHAIENYHDAVAAMRAIANMLEDITEVAEEMTNEAADEQTVVIPEKSELA